MVRPDSKSSDVGFDFPSPGSGNSVDANLPGIRMPPFGSGGGGDFAGGGATDDF